MTTNRIYTDQPLAPDRRIEITGQPALHVIQVLRLRSGAELRVFDGRGNEFHARLESARRGQITVHTGTTVPGPAEPLLDITLAQGIARHDRMDLVLQKAVELGVSTIQPLWMQRSQSHLKGERMTKRLQHWQGVIISACEQCGRNKLPLLAAPAGLTEWVVPGAGLRIMLQPDSDCLLPALSAPDGPVTLLTGPEGGLTPEEQAYARAAGFIAIRLGQRILRTETAALAALSGIQTLWGDFSSSS